MDQIELFSDNPEYDAFVEKFKPKKTTDDCYTPELIYNVVRDWACEKYGIDPQKIVRPFYPGGDYEHFPYPDGAVVLDNPPFSIYTKICNFYLDKGILFFLFAPTFTMLSSPDRVMRMHHIICDCKIVYENGAVVNTSFGTSFDDDIVVSVEPELTKKIKAAQKKLTPKKGRTLCKQFFPDNVVTAATLGKFDRAHIKFCVHRDECIPVWRLDCQKQYGKHIYGGGLLLSDRAAARKAEAEKAAAKGEIAHYWGLSDREKKIVESLGAG